MNAAERAESNHKRLVEERAAQGLPPKVTDPQMLRDLAASFSPARPEVTVIVPTEPPVLNERAARALLRILVEAAQPDGEDHT